MKTRLLASAALIGATGAALAQAPTNAELYEIIQAQQSQIETLQGDNQGGFSNPFSRTSLGGYGELHYNNIKDADDKVDFHRFVLFVNHEFNDRMRLFTELELEHSLVKDTDDGSNGGEVELEQAYIEFDLKDNLQAKGGLFLIPVGIMNETHEPNTFYGVERNSVEKEIIPTTWWEAGAALNGRNENGISWDFAIHSGLKADVDGKIRGGRQKVSNAKANDPAATARIRYTGINGLDLAATVQYQSNITQGSGEEASAVLIQTHAIYQVAETKLTALYATWDIDTFSDGPNEQTGYYVEASQKLNEKTGVFVRHEFWDNKAGDTADSGFNQQTLGVNYWPHEKVVLKADIFTQENEFDGSDKEGFNLGIGYSF